MAASLLDSRLHGALYGDPATAARLSDEAEIAAMIRVERALARAEAACGVIPAEAAAAIDRGLDGTEIVPEALAEGAAASGTPVPALVATLRRRLDPEAARWLHWGATSQDVEDTGLALRLDGTLADFAPRLDGLAATLEIAGRRWRDLPMAGRTRSQIAAPTSFGLRVARWRAPLAALRAELDGVRATIARVQLGGAVGSNDALGDRGEAVAAALAEELDLRPAHCWHVNRSGPAAAAGWCARLAGALGKMAADLILMGRSEIAEVRAGSGGGSSTMPQKANPVAAETVVALARFAASLTAPVHEAAIHVEERDGAAWALERLALPQLVLAAGAALRHAETLAATLAPDVARMRAALDLGGGAALAERASFLLARRMDRAEAQALVKQAAAEAAQGGTLAEALGRLAPEGIDWASALDPEDVAVAAAAVDAAFDRRTS